ncbi:MAG: CHAD domain-containing protein [Gloeomargarita sp. SKYBB_i_bin120]|nr:CHAD domain-containing protein [Gloeomargarita sp. SKYB120]MDW8177252.1 CHAD domain-containing protein [Gloeomargarita sp. SKYBB_i_bin120]
MGTTTMEPMTLGWWIHQHLGKAVRKWRKQEEGVKQGEDPEAIHQMRVAMRRLRSLLKGFEAVLDVPRVARKVGMLSRVLGQARDADVMLERLETRYLPVLPSQEQETLKGWIRQLRRQRQEQQRELVALLHSATYERVQKAWREWLDHPRWQPLGDRAVEVTLPHFLLMAWGELSLHPGWDIHGVADNPEGLHDLRKQIKRTRYLWEFAGDWLGEALQEPLGWLREAQEVLGQLQDGFVLEEQLGLKCPALEESLLHDRTELWRQWQTLRAQLQSRENHQRIYSGIGGRCLSPVPPPAATETAHPAAVPLG